MSCRRYPVCGVLIAPVGHQQRQDGARRFWQITHLSCDIGDGFMVSLGAEGLARAFQKAAMVAGIAHWALRRKRSAWTRSRTAVRSACSCAAFGFGPGPESGACGEDAEPEEVLMAGRAARRHARLGHELFTMMIKQNDTKGVSDLLTCWTINGRLFTIIDNRSWSPKLT